MIKKYNGLFYFSFIIFSISLFHIDCERISNQVPPYLQNVVETIGRKYAPDSRVELFEIHLIKKGDQLFVIGETTNRSLKQLLLDSLRQSSRYYDLIDSVHVLPERDLGKKRFGIVYVSVANMRKQPRYSAELVNQTVLGTVLSLYKQEKNFYFARNRDRYLGWVSGASLVKVDSTEADAWIKASHVICITNYGVVHKEPEVTSEAVVDLVAGALLEKMGQFGDWIQVRTPDGRIGYVSRPLMVDDSTFHHTAFNRNTIIITAKQFLGIPYLWGGTSTKGFDCSGYVQTVFSLHRILLPRDANQMVKIGQAIDIAPDYSQLLPGDLLFFGPDEKKITHVAIYLGHSRFIHSDGWVHINSLDPSDSLYNRYRHKTLRMARRILPDSLNTGGESFYLTPSI